MIFILNNIGLMCFGLHSLNRYIEKGRAIADELHRIRNSHRT